MDACKDLRYTLLNQCFADRDVMQGKRICPVILPAQIPCQMEKSPPFPLSVQSANRPLREHAQQTPSKLLLFDLDEVGKLMETRQRAFDLLQSNLIKTEKAKLIPPRPFAHLLKRIQTDLKMPEPVLYHRVKLRSGDILLLRNPAPMRHQISDLMLANEKLMQNANKHGLHLQPTASLFGTS